MEFQKFIVRTLILCLAGSVSIAAESITEHDVLPILLRRCGLCHAALDQEAGLDLRCRETILRGGDSGPAALSGDPDGSLLIEKIASAEMPPEKSHGQAGIEAVTGDELEIIRTWIAAGLPETPDSKLTATNPPWEKKRSRALGVCASQKAGRRGFDRLFSEATIDRK